MTDTWSPYDQLSETQRNQLDAYAALLRRFNRRINLISPDSEDDLRDVHLTHCLTLAHRSFPAGSEIVDWGTGGGLPAIPLAIAFPDVTVYAVDSVGKKVRAVRTMARRLGLDNLFAWNGRAETWTGSAHFSVSRATAPLVDLWRWHTRVADPNVPADAPGESRFGASEAAWPPGLICLKGGDLSGEIDALHDAFPATQVQREPVASIVGHDALFSDKHVLSVTSSA